MITNDTNNNLDFYFIKIDTKRNSLGNENYQFALLNKNEKQTGFQDDPLLRNVTGEAYKIIVNDTNRTISVLQFPKFFLPQIVIG